MKQILLADAGNALQHYLHEKLKRYGVIVAATSGPVQTLSQMRRDIPNLLIVDCSESREALIEFLIQKQADPIAQNIVTVVISTPINKDELNRIVSCGVKKVIPKPMRMDDLLGTIGTIFDLKIDLDTSPCSVDVQVNNDVIFLEVAHNFNSDKIEIMACKLREVISLYGLVSPFVLFTLNDLSPSFEINDNLDFLFSTILKIRKIIKSNMRVITTNANVKKFLQSYGVYKEIEVNADMSTALEELFKKNGDHRRGQVKALLDQRQEVSPLEVLQLRFKNEDKEVLKIAVVDDDAVVRTAMQQIFSKINIHVETFSSGERFIQHYTNEAYQLIFLDLMMPGMSGMEVISFLRSDDCTTPIVVISAITQRETVMAVLAAGVKQYVIKPVTADAILRKAIEILGSDFE